MIPEFRKASCILSKFYIKPQPVRIYSKKWKVVSYRNSTSNHNSYVGSAGANYVVSYRNSTSNHNLGERLVKILQLYLIEILHQTTTLQNQLKRVTQLYLIEILHQTTTSPLLKVSYFLLYLIEILHQTTTAFRLLGQF